MDEESSIVAEVELVLVLVLGRLLFALSVCLLDQRPDRDKHEEVRVSSRVEVECRYNRSCIGT